MATIQVVWIWQLNHRLTCRYASGLSKLRCPSSWRLIITATRGQQVLWLHRFIKTSLAQVSMLSAYISYNFWHFLHEISSNSCTNSSDFTWWAMRSLGWFTSFNQFNWHCAINKIYNIIVEAKRRGILDCS